MCVIEDTEWPISPTPLVENARLLLERMLSPTGVCCHELKSHCSVVANRSHADAAALDAECVYLLLVCVDVYFTFSSPACGNTHKADVYIGDLIKLSYVCINLDWQGCISDNF